MYRLPGLYPEGYALENVVFEIGGSMIKEDDSGKVIKMTEIPDDTLETMNMLVGRYWQIMEFMGHSDNSHGKAFERLMFDLGRLKGFEEGVNASR